MVGPLERITQGNPVMKMHGIGNDFVVMTDFDRKLTLSIVQKLCARHFGIGADGLVSICEADDSNADIQMVFYNPNGSIAEMCGNGIRVFTKYVVDNSICPGTFSVQTGAGILHPEIVSNSPKEAQVKVNMGKPVLYDPKLVNATTTSKDTTVVITQDVRARFVSMGNPHAVVYYQHPLQILKQFGEKIESDTRIFPEKTNVEFYTVVSDNVLQMFVYERDAGRTLACGTGACATVVAAILDEHVDPSKPVTVQLEGGDLEIEWQDYNPLKPTKSGNIYMTGGATNVYPIDVASIDTYLLQ